MKCTCDNGKIRVSAQLVSSEGLVSQEPVEINCLWCGGLGELTDEQAEQKKAFADAWCRCEDSSGSSGYRNGRSHGWTCNDCGKITQTG